ncbi:MAG: hypothetical protein PHO02_06740 [Candidatus Nanoarchaeia archaeon]|nr:hypothetical protein [Candidatus Nanoarchaeia archaeon]
MEGIKYVGLGDLESFESEQIQSLAEEGFAKLMKKTRLKEAELSVFVKKIHKGEKSHHYELILKLNAPGTKNAWFDVRHEDFDLVKLAHICFEALAVNIEHEFGKKLQKEKFVA